MSCAWLLATALVTSCSVEKRLHRPGYHVEWKHKDQPSQHPPSAQELQQQEAYALPEAHAEPAQAPLSASASADVLPGYQPAPKADLNAVSKEEPQVLEQKIPEASNRRALGDPDETPASDETKIVNGFGIASFVLAVVSLFVLGFVFGPTAIVFGAIGMSQVRRNPEKYRGNGLAVAGFVIGIISVALLIVLLLVLV